MWGDATSARASFSSMSTDDRLPQAVSPTISRGTGIGRCPILAAAANLVSRSLRELAVRHAVGATPRQARRVLMRRAAGWWGEAAGLGNARQPRCGQDNRLVGGCSGDGDAAIYPRHDFSFARERGDHAVSRNFDGPGKGAGIKQAFNKNDLRNARFRHLVAPHEADYLLIQPAPTDDHLIESRTRRTTGKLRKEPYAGVGILIDVNRDHRDLGVVLPMRFAQGRTEVTEGRHGGGKPGPTAIGRRHDVREQVFSVRRSKRVGRRLMGDLGGVFRSL